jgi:enamine deaminase RidA (YjgF/YER057c/UK114 family)
MQRKVHEGPWQKQWAFSPLVETKGGKVLWVAGHGMHHDKHGRSLAGDFDAQVRATFAGIQDTLALGGGRLTDIVTMTVFILDPRHSRRFTEIRAEHFPEGDFPASALITVAGFADPDMMVEIQCIAVVKEE